MLEALIAILIFSMGVLALVGLQAAMLKNNSNSEYRSQASFVAQQWIGVMWSDPANLANYLIPNATDQRFDISSQLPNGTRMVSQPVANQILIVISWQSPGELFEHNYTTTASIVGG